MDLQFSLDQLLQAAHQFLSLTTGKKIIAFHGEMGAGKTTFIHALCEVMGVKDVVSSPTFSIINEYEYLENGEAKKIFHIDLYRLKDEEEAIRAGVEDCLLSHHWCWVEWPDRAPGIFPEHTLHVYLSMVDDKTRQISWSGKLSE